MGSLEAIGKSSDSLHLLFLFSHKVFYSIGKTLIPSG